MRFRIEALPPAGLRSRLLGLIRVLELTVAAEKANGKVEVSGVGDEHRLSSVLSAILDSGAFIHRVEREQEPLHNVFSHLANLGKRVAVSDPSTGISVAQSDTGRRRMPY